ncbi:MAG: hypothetical protein IPN96_04055 [Anaerolineales bacterium]|uniref:hypothetical protein n=1 Tax=Candidatus Villigracilis proximus TaxID=3140683 RepID=UPI003136685F|nr:hypothetical protein [Anaerolineales bacterium]MBK9209375.1 hypothetical protein [Anaerolineales bacterium]
MLTRYHSGFHRQTGRHSLDDQHHPVLITKNNFGFPTLKQTLPDFSSQLREDFQSPTRIRFTPDLGLADRFDGFTRSHQRF